MQAEMNMQSRIKKKLKETYHFIGEKIHDTLSNILFWIKGVDAEEDVARVIRTGCVLGASLLIVSLMGLTIHYVVSISTADKDKKAVTKVVEDKSQNQMLKEQYAKLVERVEELTRKKDTMEEAEERSSEELMNSQIREQVKKYAKNGKNGMEGKQGEAGNNGADGKDGADGIDGRDGIDGENGKSAYEQAIEAGFTGSEEEFAKILSNVGNNLQDMDKKLQLDMEDLSATKTVLETTNNQLLDMLERFNQHTEEMQQKVDDMHTNFQNGCNIIAAAITAEGVETATNSTPQTMAENIHKIAQNKYNQGVTDGMTSALENVQVEYEYNYHDGDSQNGGACYGEPQNHYHSSMCYGVCPDRRMVYYGEHKDGNEKRHWDYRCHTCGFTTSPWFSCGDSYEETHTSRNTRCGYSNGEFLGCEVICGYENGQILSAKIIY